MHLQKPYMFRIRLLINFVRRDLVFITNNLIKNFPAIKLTKTFKLIFEQQLSAVTNLEYMIVCFHFRY